MAGIMIEAVIWCPVCEEDRFFVKRVPSGQEGVYTHKLERADGTSFLPAEPVDHKKCGNCGEFLERKPNGS